MQGFLNNMSEYSGVVALGLGVAVYVGTSPASEIATGALVFGAISTGSKGLEIGFYSDTPVQDTISLGIQTVVNTKNPIVDQTVDTLIDQAIRHQPSYSISPYGTPSHNNILNCHGGN
jgi:hypothetical protein